MDISRDHSLARRRAWLVLGRAAGPNRRGAACAVVIAVLVALVGCGGQTTKTASKTVTARATTSHSARTSGSTTSTTSTNASSVTPTTASSSSEHAADKQIAQQANIRLMDFPPGWGQTDRDRSPSSGSACAAIRSAKAATTARDHSPSFSTNNNDTVADSVIYVFHDQTTAEHAFAQLSTESTRKCLGAIFTRGLSKSGLKVGAMSTGTVSIGPIGDERAASRFTVPVSKNATNVTVYVDVVVVRVDRGIAFTELLDVFSPFDRLLEAKLVRRSAARLRTGLMAGG
jgi:hypothetical protein